MKKFILSIFIFLIISNIANAQEIGLGIEAIRKGGVENLFAPLQIRSIQPNSPAERAKIVLDWYIISINGKLTKDLTDQDCLELLNNHPRVELFISPIQNIYNQSAVKLTLTNEEGFSNIIKNVPKTKGVGLGIYKYDLNLKMPLIITNVEKNSPAELAGIQKNMLILKINNQSTKELTVSECEKLLNNKNLELEVTDLQGNNIKNYKLKLQNYYANELKNIGAGWVLSEAIITFLKDNPKEIVLAEYFKTFNPSYNRSNGMTNQEVAEEDIQKLQKPYLQYKSNPNDMDFNKNLYDGLNTFVKQYKELKRRHIETVKDILVYYGKVNSTASEQEVLNYIKNSEIDNKDYYLDKISFYENCISMWNKWAKEIYDYSVAYEKKQKGNIPKITTPYFIAQADFREILWGWHSAKQPQRNGIYVISTGTGARVLQTITGGILVTAEPSRLSSNARVIFISTKRQFADEDWIKDNMFIIFEGYYNYTNTLGASRKIYKFKEVPQAEYWNRIKKNTYYFIN